MKQACVYNKKYLSLPGPTHHMILLSTWAVLNSESSIAEYYQELCINFQTLSPSFTIMH
jgi:hypothetical protein